MQYTKHLFGLILILALAGCQVQLVSESDPEGDSPAAMEEAAQGTVPAADGTLPPANQTVPTEAADLYVDPNGLFTAPIPTNWTATQEEGYVTLSDPDGAILMHLLTLPADDLESAVDEGWQLVDPAFDLAVEDTMSPPARDGIEEVYFVQYEIGDDEVIYQAISRLYDGTAYLLLVDAELATAQRRQAQISIIDSGFTITTPEEETDLSSSGALPADAAIIAELESFVEQGLADFGIPGAAVGIVQDGEIVYMNGFGVTEAGGEPITPQTHMMIGSTGKSLTTLLMAMLVDEGLMEWDTPVIDVLPEFAVADPALSETITLRNLVCACTGVPRRDNELLFNADELSAEDIVDSLSTFEFFTDFGEAFQYSNQMVGTGGYAAAAADGAEFGSLFDGYTSSLGSRVLDAVDMPSTTLSFDEVRERGQYAQPHAATFDFVYELLPLEDEEVLVPIAPAGSHWSTLEDMANYMLMQLANGVAVDGTRVVSEENLAETREAQVPVSANTDYGLGWFIGEYSGQRLIDHGGNTLGFTSDFAFLPDADLGIIVLTNAQGTNSFSAAVRNRLFELVFEQPPTAGEQAQFSLEQAQEAFAEPEGLLDSVDAEAVAPYLATFRNEALGEVTLSLEGDALVLDVGEFASALRPLEEEGELEGYLATDAPIIGTLFELIEDEAGNPTVSFGAGASVYVFELVGE